MVRKALISAYDKNIYAKLKDELCAGLEVNNYNNYMKEAASASNSLSISSLALIFLAPGSFNFYFQLIIVAFVVH